MRSDFNEWGFLIISIVTEIANVNDIFFQIHIKIIQYEISARPWEMLNVNGMRLRFTVIAYLSGMVLC